MKLISVTSQNFLSTGPNPVTIPLDIKGLTLVLGINEDAPLASSNGAGKGAALNGIAYAGWGQTIYEQKADEVINEHVGKNCKVTLLLQDGEDNYSITRTRGDTTSHKPNDLILKKNDVDISGSTNEATQDKINSILGMTYDVFRALMPGCGINVATLTDKDIKLLLEKILDTEELSKAYKLAKEKYTDLDKKLEVKKAKYSSLVISLADSKLRLEEYERKSNTFETNRDSSLTDTKNKLADVLAELGSISFKSEEELEKELADILDSLSKLEGTLLEISQEEAKSKLLYTKASAPINSEFNKVAKQMKEFDSLTDCPTCYSKVGEEHKASVKADFLAKHAELGTKSLRLESNYRKICKKLKEKKDSITVLKEPLALRMGEVKESLKAAKIYNTEANTKKIKLELTKANLYSEITRLENLKNDFGSLISKEQSSVAILTRDIDAVQEEIKALEEDLAIYAFWVDSFSPSGLRSYMIDTVVPFLNDRAKYYCDLLTSGEMTVKFNTKSSQKSGKVVEKFNIEVSQKHGCSQFKGNSLGEKARANLVISLALGALAALRSTKKLEFRMFDEVFDNIDGVGREAVISLLSECLSQYGTIFVVTHNDEFQKSFKQKITFRKKNCFSEIVGIEYE